MPHEFARCVASRHRKEAAAALALSYRSQAQSQAIHSATSVTDSCWGPMISGMSMRLSDDVLAGGMAEFFISAPASHRRASQTATGVVQLAGHADRHGIIRGLRDPAGRHPSARVRRHPCRIGRGILRRRRRLLRRSASASARARLWRWTSGRSVSSSPSACTGTWRLRP